MKPFLTQVCTLYFALSRQINFPNVTPASLLAAGKWMSAPELVHVSDTAWKHAELDLQQEGVTVQTSRQLHDAAEPVCILMPVTGGTDYEGAAVVVENALIEPIQDRKYQQPR
ncbi:TPA: hypothetical protein ACH3X3_003296 [Trebouxia sp. C0006]